ncbi:SMI1/KNR4 family protein [Sphingobacterium paucimobilis]|uniref:Knr4/Smi1-like domain-containing protein n=1 Tax=Sphingobacterium paucimobilis HER1398 TaxID=1346330 RepID=U2HAY3_9SPHI|nr:SMI1/KNR4 family protein [Sphingobacterium paucimobilis]ERJ58911.1 hypothetical protein M472_09020 [Sphingobacterium paucimobilis HER1398]
MDGFNLKIVGQPTEFGDTNFLESYRFSNGRSFPASYKAFVRFLGYGLLMGQFHIYIPMGTYGDSWDIRSEGIRSTYYQDLLDHDIWFDLEPDGSIALLKRLVPFAASDNGYYLFWDVDSGIENEFDIYLTDFRGTGFLKIANTLYDLVHNLTSDSITQRIPFQREALPAIFECYYKSGQFYKKCSISE